MFCLKLPSVYALSLYQAQLLMTASIVIQTTMHNYTGTMGTTLLYSTQFQLTLEKVNNGKKQAICAKAENCYDCTILGTNYVFIHSHTFFNLCLTEVNCKYAVIGVQKYMYNGFSQ